MEPLFGLICLAVFAGGVVLVAVLSMSSRLHDLEQRFRQLEHRSGTSVDMREAWRGLEDRIRRLERRVAALSERPGPVPEPHELPELPPPEPEPVSVPVVEEAPAPPAPPPVPAPTSAAAPARLLSEDPAVWEQWIGRRVLGWSAVVLGVFAVGFFLKYAYDRGWIVPAGRVAIGELIGAALIVLGARVHRRGAPLPAQMLFGCGVVVLYLSTYAAFGFYDLISQPVAGVLLTLLTVGAVVLAVAVEAYSIGLLAVLGGLLTPLLLHTEEDQFGRLAPYLVVLAAGAFGLNLWRPWPVLRALAWLGVFGEFWLWYQAHYTPARLADALLFFAVLLAIAWVQLLLVGRRRTSNADDWLVGLGAPFLAYAAAHYLLELDYARWQGPLAAGLALAAAGVAVLAHRLGRGDRNQVLVPTAVATAFVAIALLKELDAHWVGVAWAVEGFILWAFGLQRRQREARLFGAVVLAAALVRVLMSDLKVPRPDDFIPLFNGAALPVLLVAALLAAAAVLARWLRDGLTEEDRVIVVLTELAGSVLFWIVLLQDTFALSRRLGITPRWTLVPGTAEGLLLWWLGLRFRLTDLRVLAALMLAVGALGCLAADVRPAQPERFVPLLNSAALPGVIVTALLVAAAVLVWRLGDVRSEVDRVACLAAALVAAVIFWIVLAQDTYELSVRLGITPRWLVVPGAFEGLLLYWLGLRLRLIDLRIAGAIMLGVGAFGVLQGDFPPERSGAFVPFVNAATVPLFLTALALTIAAILARRYVDRLTDADRAFRLTAGLVAALLVWLALSVDTYAYCRVVLDPEATRPLLPQAALSVLWSMYAAVLLALGFALDRIALRWLALALFAVTLAKVFLLDLSFLSGMYRILACLVLALVLAGATWAYQRRPERSGADVPNNRGCSG